MFQKDIVRASNGYLFISDADQIAYVHNSDLEYIYVKEGNFQVNDLVLIKSDNSSSGLLQVNSIILKVKNNPV